MSVDIFKSPWWEGVENALADFVDMMGHEFASRVIRENPRATFSFGKGFHDLTEQEIGHFVREAFDEDGVRFFRIGDDSEPFSTEIHGQGKG